MNVQIIDITNDEFIKLLHSDMFGIRLEQFSSMSYKLESELEQIIILKQKKKQIKN